MSTRKDAVREGYARVAGEDFATRAEALARIASAFGYADDDLAALPDGANMGLSCGNPVALASLREGETVVDLGSGGGLDVFLSARAVGPKGHAIGIDMTEEMVALARRNAAAGGYANVEFHLAAIEAMPLQDGSVDCVISNCVLNLVDDKDAALAEIFRVLRPGGRLAVSDIALKRTLPAAVAEDVTAWVSCIAGALSIDDNLSKLAAAGFADAEATPTGADLNVYKEAGGASCCGPKADEPEDPCCGPKPSADTEGCCGPAPEGKQGGCAPAPNAAAANGGFHDRMAHTVQELDLNDYAAAVRIFAVKPRGD